MKAFEKISMRIRHVPILEHADWLWNPVRPIYEQALRYFWSQGIERTINGSDRFMISPQARGISENYEPDVWNAVMSELRTVDTFVDVGAFIGLYTIAVAVRHRGSGRVVAFEPDIHNFLLLQEHIRLNRLEGQVELHRTAVSDRPGSACFLANGSSEARLVSSEQSNTTKVEVITLDRTFAGERVDILKIDVEGYEEMVLRGAHNLLRSPERRPRAIFIEVHPYAWQSLGTTSESLLSLLGAAGYQTKTVQGAPIRAIDHYGEIVARITC
jgi:FkbM family methyltransferase